MTLKNDFYEVVSADKDAAPPYFRIRLNPSHQIFQAHFPGEPVTPGVCLIQTGLELAEDLLGRKLRLYLLKNVKFLSVVSPLQTPEFVFRITKVTLVEDSDEVALQLTADDGDTPLLKMSMVCLPI